MHLRDREVENMPIDQTFLKLSRQLRQNETPWEKKLWMHLKGHKFLGLKFKRQIVIGPYIYDFSCFEKKLIIELDGGHHTEPEISIKDKEKQSYIENLGYRVVRFNNNDVQDNIESVLEAIRLVVS